MKTKLLKKLRKEASEVFRIVPFDDGVDVLIKYDDKSKKNIELILHREYHSLGGKRIRAYRKANMRTWILLKVKEMKINKK